MRFGYKKSIFHKPAKGSAEEKKLNRVTYK